MKEPKLMAITKKRLSETDIKINNKNAECIGKFKYLVWYITNNLDPDVEAKNKCKHVYWLLPII